MKLYYSAEIIELHINSYYLQMPSAFNPWSDLDSYSRDTMEQELQNLNEETPVIILGNSYALYEEGGEEALKKGLDRLEAFIEKL